MEGKTWVRNWRTSAQKLGWSCTQFWF